MTKSTGQARMGAVSSKKKLRKWSWSGPPGEHSPYPIDPLPYPGPQLLYCFLDVMASYRVLENQLNLGHQAVTTNVEDSLDEFTHCYEEGFCLNSFIKVPGLKTTTEVADWGQRQPFQAIFSRPDRPGFNMSESWGIEIEKKILSTRTLAFDEDDEDNDLIDTINRYAVAGCRLACAQPVGYVQSVSTNTQYGVIGVELFFNVPKHKQGTRYTYHAVKVSANYHIIPDATQTIQQTICDADFMGQMMMFLNKGWKLVDICMDTTALAETFKMKASSKKIDTIWIFEKETALLSDMTPVYEGVIIEYIHKVKAGLEGESPCKDWRPVIAGMGVTGWELASIIQTPALVQSSFTTYTFKLLMVFQRQLVPSFEKWKRMRKTNSMPRDGPTSSPFGKPRRFGGSGSNMQAQEVHGYNHHGLNRHVYSTEPVMNGFVSRNGPESPPSYWEAVTQDNTCVS